MLIRLFLAFALVPLAELYLLIAVGSRIGPLPTIAIVLATGFVGAWLARRQGLQTMTKIQTSLQQGRMPAEAMIDGVIILIAGLMLLTPGFLTDAAGVLLLIPRTRVGFKRWLRNRFDAWARQGGVTVVRFDRRP